MYSSALMMQSDGEVLKNYAFSNKMFISNIGISQIATCHFIITRLSVVLGMK
jgi:hypothetical protein